MCEKDFNSLVNAEFLADYERRFAEIGQAEQNAVDACAELDVQCEREIAEIDKQHQEFKLAAEQTLASIEERSNAQFAGLKTDTRLTRQSMKRKYALRSGRLTKAQKSAKTKEPNSIKTTTKPKQT